MTTTTDDQADTPAAPAPTLMSQLELLRRSVAELEREHKPDNPFVRGLKSQIAMLEREEWRKANGGWWGPNAAWMRQPCGR